MNPSIDVSRGVSERHRIVLIGGGLSAVRCAETLRSEGYTGELTMVSNESFIPYDRPPLSKEFLDGSMSFERLHLHPESWYRENNIHIKLNKEVVRLDRRFQEVVCADGEKIPYDFAVLATGARPRLISKEPIDPGSNVFYLRSSLDAVALKTRLQMSQHVSVVGAGLIGLEVAATARLAGCKVTVVEAGSFPLGRVVDAEFGQVLMQIHEAQGVNFKTGVSVRSIKNGLGETEIALSNGSLVQADTVVVGIGVEPNTNVAEASGLETGNGILVDEHGRTSDHRVFAVGDCACLLHQFYGKHIRLESWKHAQSHGISVAKSILGLQVPYLDQPYAWSIQYGINFQFVGMHAAENEVVWRGDPASGKAVLCSLRDDSVVAACGINSPKDVRLLQSLIARRAKVDRHQLQDSSLQLAATSAKS